MRYILIGILIIAIIIFAIVLSRNTGPTRSTIEQNQETTQEQPTTQQETQEQTPETRRTVLMSNNNYQPSTINANSGETITFTNRDNVLHTVTDRNGSFDIDANPGATVNLTLTRTGTYNFFCKIHPNMTGTLNIR